MELFAYIILADGYGDWLSKYELDGTIDPKTVRKYDSDIDPDFIGAHG